jgi:hypothetical protein
VRPGQLQAALPGAGPREVDWVMDDVMKGSGPAVVTRIGKKDSDTPNFPNGEARTVVDNLTAGLVSERDIIDRGPTALTAPRPRGQRCTGVFISIRGHRRLRCPRLSP